MKKLLLALAAAALLLPVVASARSEVTVDGNELETVDILDFNGMVFAPAVSNTDSARAYYDSVDDQLYLSVNGGAFGLFGGGTTELSDDTTPALGGDLDAQGFDIIDVGTIEARTADLTAGLLLENADYEDFPSVAPGSVTTGTLTLWFAADSITGLSDGENVTSWPDDSGNTNDAADGGGSNPTWETNELNGEPVVRFNSATDYLTTGSATGISGNAEVTILAVMKVASTPVANYPALFCQSVAAGTGKALCLTYYNHRPALDFSTTRAIADTDETLTQNTWHLVALRKSAGDVRTYSEVLIDGDLVDLDYNGGTNTPNITDGAMVLGRLDATRYFEGDLAELLVFVGDLGYADLMGVHKYLATKYNLTADSRGYPAENYIRTVDTDGTPDNKLVITKTGNIGVNVYPRAGFDLISTNTAMTAMGVTKPTAATTDFLHFMQGSAASATLVSGVDENGHFWVGTDFANATFNSDIQTATHIGMLIQGHASQTAHLFVAENSGGTDLAVIEADGDIATVGTITSTATGSLGWSAVSGANTACTTTCTNAAVFGFDSDTSVIVGPADASADICICAGGS